MSSGYLQLEKKGDLVESFYKNYQVKIVGWSTHPAIWALALTRRLLRILRQETTPVS